MRSFSAIVLAAFVALLASPAAAHMEMKDPLPYRSKFNTNAPAAQYDYSMTVPLKEDGSDFPCKGYHKDGTDSPTATYAAGGSYTVQLDGTAFHNGGSCQLSLSYDGGNTWEVIKSFIGSCPSGPNASMNFDMPSDVKTGKAIFAWTWFNHSGNREMYMNCAPIEITGGAAKRSPAKRAARPAMFVANVGNGCSTAPETDLQFPDAGSVVQTGGSGGAVPPVGNCPAGAGAATNQGSTTTSADNKSASTASTGSSAPSATTDANQNEQSTAPTSAASQGTSTSVPKCKRAIRRNL